MESNNDIDKLFKDKLNNREFVIKESFLADLDQKLPVQKPARNSKGIILFFALLLVCASLTFYLLSVWNVADKNTSQSTLKDSAETIEKETITNPIGVNSELVDSDEDFADTEKSRSKQREGNVKVESDSKEKMHEGVIDKKETIKKSYLDKTSTAYSNHEKSNVVISNDAENTLINEGIANKNTFVISDVKKDELLAFDDSINENQSAASVESFDEIDTTLLATEKVKIDVEKTSLNEIGVDSVTKEENTSSEYLAQKDTLIQAKKDEVNVPQAELIEEDTVTNLEETVGEFLDTISVDIKPDISEDVDSILPNKTSKWMVSVFGGPSLALNQVKGASPAYITRRNSEESGLVSASLGARINYNFNQKINLSIGMNTMKYGEKVNYSAMYNVTSRDSSYTETTYTPVQDSMGGWDTLITTITIDTTFFDTTSLDYMWKNEYSYLTIPVMMGYKFTFNKLSVNIRLGGSCGILLKGNGKYPSEGFNNIEPVDPKKVVFNLVASTVVGYKINNMNLFIEPKYRYNTTGLFVNSNFTQKYSGLGCNFGVSFDF